MSANIEALVKKHTDRYDNMAYATVEGCIEDAVTELSETHALELRAYETTVANLEGRIAQMEKERDELRKDAERYRWLREQSWDAGELCIVSQPKHAVKLGHDCPSLFRLDAAIDAAIAQGKGE